MTIISDVLRGPYGDIQPGVVIAMRAKGTSAKVLAANSSSVVTDAAGKYSMTVFPGEYTVNVSTLGDVGDIKVFTDSVDGTLNDFLIAPSKPEDLTPEVVKTVDQMRAAAANSAAAAKVSENNTTAAMTNALSKISKDDQSVASKVLFNRPLRLSAGTDGSNFLPPSQGAWITWNRIPGTGTSDFVNHKGTAGGGFRFWNTDGTTAGALAAFNGDASFVQYAPVGATALTHRFLDNTSAEKGAIISNPTDGSMKIRWNGTSYSLDCRTDGFVAHPKGSVISTSLATAAAVVEAVTATGGINNAPFNFRGSDSAQFANPSNYSIGTWYGFSVVPTSDAPTLGSGVTRGQPVFYVNARAGTAHVLNNMYVGGSPVVRAGQFGVGGYNSMPVTSLDTVSENAFISVPQNTTGSPTTGSWAGIQSGLNSVNRWEMVFAQELSALDIRARTRNYSGSWTAYSSLWHSTNTTVDANGFLKRASPIVKLFGTGESELNVESQGVTTERLSEGVYRVSGVFGFNGDGAWGGPGNGIEIPVDDNKRPLVWVESKVLPDGDIEIRTYHRTYDTGPYSARNIEAMDSGEVDKKKRPIFVEMPDGTPIDIPEGRFIDLRVEMPVSDEVASEIETEESQLTTESDQDVDELGNVVEPATDETSTP